MVISFNVNFYVFSRFNIGGLHKHFKIKLKGVFSMGTRSTIKFYEGKNFLCGVYQQFDGYPDGVGKELKAVVLSKPFVNGIGKSEDVFNGFRCFAAQFIAKFKRRAGGLYMTCKDDKQEYNYLVIKKTSTIEIVCLEEESFNMILHLPKGIY